jgi:hypothetical protein
MSAGVTLMATHKCQVWRTGLSTGVLGYLYTYSSSRQYSDQRPITLSTPSTNIFSSLLFRNWIASYSNREYYPTNCRLPMTL